MSRIVKPDNVDVLHYRLYQANASGETLDLLPNGGLTLAVQWPTWNSGLIMAAAHCSIEDAFVRSTGYDKAVGRFHSEKQRMYVRPNTYRPYFDAEHITFEAKCEALHMMFFGDPADGGTVGSREVSVDDFFEPEFWSEPIVEFARSTKQWAIWLSRTHCANIPSDMCGWMDVSPTWPYVKFW